MKLERRSKGDTLLVEVLERSFLTLCGLQLVVAVEQLLEKLDVTAFRVQIVDQLNDVQIGQTKVEVARVERVAGGEDAREVVEGVVGEHPLVVGDPLLVAVVVRVQMGAEQHERRFVHLVLERDRALTADAAIVREVQRLQVGVDAQMLLAYEHVLVRVEDRVRLELDVEVSAIAGRTQLTEELLELALPLVLDQCEQTERLLLQTDHEQVRELAESVVELLVDREQAMVQFVL